MEGKKRVKTTEYNLSLRSRDDCILGRTHTAEKIHLGRRWLDVNVDELLQTPNICSFGAKGSPVEYVMNSNNFSRTRQSP